MGKHDHLVNERQQLGEARDDHGEAQSSHRGRFTSLCRLGGDKTDVGVCIIEPLNYCITSAGLVFGFNEKRFRIPQQQRSLSNQRPTSRLSLRKHSIGAVLPGCACVSCEASFLPLFCVQHCRVLYQTFSNPASITYECFEKVAKVFPRDR